jgi:hypothetical protein
MVGLNAMKSLVTSTSFYVDGGRHMKVVMPVILENIHSDRPAHISLLQRREGSNEEYEKETRSRLRQSMSVQRPSISLTEPLETDPALAVGTTADADQRADEEVGVLALQSLRQMFSADNRGQARLATTALLSFVVTHRSNAPKAVSGKTWAIELFETVCHWTPVQDRFIILVTAVESLIRSPVVESDFQSQLELTAIIGWLLRSNINFIGLSIMDVLIGLIQHILLLLQLGGGSSSQHRIQLLSELQHCIGWLATHVYYSDQVGDMVSALLARLKPSSSSELSSPIAASAEKPQTDGFFSSETARVLALQAVKDILTVANSRRNDGPIATGRNRVDVIAWENTQWLLRDPDARVRQAYVDALLTWLFLEVDKTKLRLVDEHVQRPRGSRETAINGGSTTQRAVSNASQTSRRQTQATRSTFLELLHLAAYESVLQHAGHGEVDILVIHLLLATTVQKLGANSIRHGLPMVLRLQEDVESMPSLPGRVMVSSLVYGYLWAVTEAFRLGSSEIGQRIRGDIQRRIDTGLWSSTIRIPPLLLDQINTVVPHNGTALASDEMSIRQGLRPFQDREILVEEIAAEYQRVLLSPPASPQQTPRRPSQHARTPSARSASVPTITTSGPSLSRHDMTFPAAVRDQMLSSWSIESCLIDIESRAARAMSVNSRGTNTTNLLTANGSPTGSMPNLNNGKNRSGSPSPNAYTNPNNTFGGTPAARHFSAKHRERLSPAASARLPLHGLTKPTVIRVDELKRALHGNFVAAPPPAIGRNSESVVDDAESMMSMSYAGSEFDDASFVEQQGNHSHVPQTQAQGNFRNPSVEYAERPARQPGQPIPPVAEGTGAVDFAERNVSRVTLNDVPSRGPVGNGGKVDLQALLGEIDESGSRERPVSAMVAPPY